MTIAEALQRAKLDPEMKKKSFYEQQMVIRAIVDQLVLDDPQFRSVPDPQKAIVYQNVVNQAVGNWMPALNSYDQPLTDEDRAALERGLFADVPGTQDSYKRGLWILERLQAGDPRAAKEAEKWIVGNSAKTNSLLVQVSAGAKDAIETLFSGDKPWNSLALNTQDFHKIADAMYQHMPSNVASQTETLSGLTGMAIAAGETIALNVLFVGGPGRAALMAGKWPGLFTQKMWNAVKAKELAQVTLRSKTLWGVTIPNILDAAIGGGLTDRVRSFPRLIEAGAIQGPEKFWKQVVKLGGNPTQFIANNPQYSNVLYKNWDKKKYKGGEKEWGRMSIAIEVCTRLNLSPELALDSASYGSFQIMGENSVLCGYPTAHEMLASYNNGGEPEQLASFIRFVKSTHLDDELRARNWAGFAQGYNGSKFRENKYDVKLSAAYKKHSK